MEVPLFPRPPLLMDLGAVEVVAAGEEEGVDLELETKEAKEVKEVNQVKEAKEAKEVKEVLCRSTIPTRTHRLPTARNQRIPSPYRFSKLTITTETCMECLR